MQIQSFSPLSGKKLATYTAVTSEEADAIIQRVVHSQIEWQKLGLSEKKKLFTNLQNIIRKEKKRIMETIYLEVGKPLADCEYEVEDILAGLEVYIGRLSEVEEKKSISFKDGIVDQSFFGIKHSRIGVTGVITPWNYPFWMPMTSIIPSLLAGSPVVLKPSEDAVGVGLLIEKIVRDAGFPMDSLRTVIGGAYIGSRIVASEQIGRLIFTGSTTVGLLIGNTRTKNKNNHFTLEMGGNSAGIIMDDAHLENAIKACFWNGCYYAGQACTSIKRLLVHKKVYSQVKKGIVELAKRYNQPEMLTQHIGAMIHENSMYQTEYRVQQAMKAGNRLLEGGTRVSREKLPHSFRKGNFFPVTVMEITNREVDLIQKETFAPVIPLISFNSLDEAIGIANETEFGLSANIFSSDQNTLDRLVEELDAGMIFVNDSEVAYPGGNFWKGLGQSYISTGADDRLDSMYEKKIVWKKDAQVERPYWFT